MHGPNELDQKPKTKVDLTYFTGFLRHHRKNFCVHYLCKFARVGKFLPAPV